MPRFNTVGTALSNFAALRTHIPDPLFPHISYPTVEHYYQAQKFLDEALRLRIAQASNASPVPFRLPTGDTIDLKAGRAAKALSRIGTLRPDWESVKLPTMQEALCRKFEDPAFRQLLAATAPATIAEVNSWGDRFWGQDEFGYGLNHLGRLLTQLRDSAPPPIPTAATMQPPANQGLEAFARLRPTFQEVSNLLQRQASIPIDISRKSRISNGDLDGAMGNHFSDFGRHPDPAHWDLPYREHLLKSVKENPAFAMLLRGLAGRPLHCAGCKGASATEQCHGSRLLNASLYLASPKGHLEFPAHPHSIAPDRNRLALTTVGSRETPQPILAAMRRLGAQLSAQGYTLRSGHASGADQAWESGALSHSRTAPLEIYLPNPGFQGAPPNDPRYLADISPEALKITAMRHPAPHALGDFATKAMARNAHQVLGPSLSDPSRALLYWAPTNPIPRDLSNNIKGGTSQAVRIAHAHGVPTIRIDENTSIDDLLAILSAL